MSEEPPKLNKTDGWDESFVEMIEYCLIKDPSKRLVIFKMVDLVILQGCFWIIKLQKVSTGALKNEVL